MSRHRNCLFCVLLLSTAHISAAGQRYALVIGIDGYRALDKLTSCVADAEALAKVLEESGGFKVIRLTDRAPEADRPTLATVRRRIEHVATAAEKGDTVLLFFSGHGVERGGAGYLVPIDGDPDNAVPLAWVNEQLEKSAAATKVAIFDCCHAGATSRGVGGISGGLRSAVMLLSCSKGELSHNDAASGHGVFTRYLVEGLRGAADGADDSAKDAQVTISELYRYVRKHVVDWSLAQGKKQTPLCLPEEGSSVALVRLKTREELEAQRKALQKSLETMQETGRREVVEALRDEIRRLEAQLAALAEGTGASTAALAKFKELKILHDVRLQGMLDDALKTYRPTSQVVARIKEEMATTLADMRRVAPEAAEGLVAIIQARQTAYQELTREMLPTARRATELQGEMDGLRDRLGELVPYLADDEALRIAQMFGLQRFSKWPFDEAEAKWRQQLAAKMLGVKVEEDLDLGGGVKLTMVLIPPGEFTIGDGRNWSGLPSATRKRIRIESPFWMGKTEVTQAQWEAVMRNNPSSFKGANNPVERVSWNDIQEFLRKVNGGLKGGALTLPTEAQWEYACRAGSASAFYFGDDEQKRSEYAWHGGNSRGTAHPVGQKSPNAWGLHDMHGNVQEWCASPYTEKRDGGEQKGAEAPCDMRALRGGSWRGVAPLCLLGDLAGGGPDARYDDDGFRVVRAARTF